MIVTGFNARKSVLVISDHADQIADDIIHRVGRGVTFLEGEGAYSKHKKKIILTITTITDIPKLKELIFVRDPEAFIVINDTLEVINKKTAVHWQSQRKMFLNQKKAPHESGRSRTLENPYGTTTRGPGIEGEINHGGFA
jgi:hypothetical protein